MTRNSRRTLLKSAAAGAAAIGLVGASRGLAGSGTAARGSIETGSEPLVAYVSDARKGEIVRRDAALVARLVAIAKEAGDVIAS